MLSVSYKLLCVTVFTITSQVVAKKPKKKLKHKPVALVVNSARRRSSICTSGGLLRTSGGASGATNPFHHRHPARLFVDRRQSEANAGMPCGILTPPPIDTMNSINKDESLLFEANEQHRVRFTRI